jgi:hypothetical protein
VREGATGVRAGGSPGVEWLRRFVHDQGSAHEIFVIAVSYVFVFFGAWNDSLVGFKPNLWSHLAETTMAGVLLLEMVSRVALTSHRTVTFHLLLLLDGISVLTVVPGLKWLTFARAGRLLYAGARLMRLLDRLACRTKNATYLVGLYPIIIPLVAAVVYALEKNAPGSQIHTYLDAVAVCFQFALSLGNVRPANPWAMALCGAVFLMGIICIGIATNAISSRYQDQSN